MPPIQTAEEAATRADQFISRYYVIKRLLSVHRQGDSWRLVYDIGIFPPASKVEVLLDAATGNVTAYGPVDE